MTMSFLHGKSDWKIKRLKEKLLNKNVINLRAYSLIYKRKEEEYMKKTFAIALATITLMACGGKDRCYIGLIRYMDVRKIR